MKILIARPEPDATLTARAVEAMGHQAITSPLVKVEPIPFGEFDLADTRNLQLIVLTSRNAARAIVESKALVRLKHLPVYTVGDKTKEVAEAAGFADVTSADGTTRDLVRLIRQMCRQEDGDLLYLAGETRKADLEQGLSRIGFNIKTKTVYRIASAVDLSEAALTALKSRSVDGILLYSARSADRLHSVLKSHRLLPLPKDTKILCLSADVADRLEGETGGTILIAPHPTQRHLLAILGPHD